MSAAISASEKAVTNVNCYMTFLKPFFASDFSS